MSQLKLHKSLYVLGGQDSSAFLRWPGVTTREQAMQEARLRRGPVFRVPPFLIWNLTVLGLIFALLSPSSPSFAATPVSASIVVDAASGQVLSESNADLPTYPASLTKMMTLYLTFEALQKSK